MVHKFLNMASSVSENTTLLADESIFNDNFDEILQILEEDEFVDKLSDEICVNVSNIILFFALKDSPTKPFGASAITSTFVS